MNKEVTEIIQVMRRAHGRDIHPFDETFLMKTLDKRMAEVGAGSVVEYSALLASNGVEAEAFSSSLNIPYSEFFRNTLTFALLEKLILPLLVEEKRNGGRGEIRVWSAGCASGQEAYSIAMLLEELIDSRGSPVAYRIFATDCCGHELAAARRGAYDPGAVRNARLKDILKYFRVKGESYQVIESLKKRIDFSCHDLLDECFVCPPASIYGDFDLVFCSNLLFYYRPEIRRVILNRVHGALAPGGYLATGEAEREIVAKHGGFRAVVTPASIFQKTAGAVP